MSSADKCSRKVSLVYQIVQRFTKRSLKFIRCLRAYFFISAPLSQMASYLRTLYATLQVILCTPFVDFKDLHPRCRYQRIAEQISTTFEIQIDKDMARRILAAHYKPVKKKSGPSWLTFPGHTKDSLWSMDLFKPESIVLKIHWVWVVMDQHTRAIVGFAIQPIAVDGAALCRMFNEVISGIQSPKRLSFDHDPIFRYDQWIRNPGILDIVPIRTIPCVPISHSFVERLIGTIRREYLNHLYYWNSDDLMQKLESFNSYYNTNRTLQGLLGRIPDKIIKPATFENDAWKPLCKGLFHMPIAA